MADRLTDAMREELTALADKKPRFLQGRSAHGGRVATWRALLKRGLIDDRSRITPAGLEAIGRAAGVDLPVKEQPKC